MDTTRIHANLHTRGGVLPPMVRALAQTMPDVADDTHGGVVEIAYSAPYDALDRNGPDDDGMPSVEDRIAIVASVLTAALASLQDPDVIQSFRNASPPQDFPGDDAASTADLGPELAALEALLDGDDAAADPFDYGD